MLENMQTQCDNARGIVIARALASLSCRFVAAPYIRELYGGLLLLAASDNDEIGPICLNRLAK
jgi:hypothetical protein